MSQFTTEIRFRLRLRQRDRAGRAYSAFPGSLAGFKRPLLLRGRKERKREKNRGEKGKS